MATTNGKLVLFPLGRDTWPSGHQQKLEELIVYVGGDLQRILDRPASVEPFLKRNAYVLENTPAAETVVGLANVATISDILKTRDYVESKYPGLLMALWVIFVDADASQTFGGEELRMIGTLDAGINEAPFWTPHSRAALKRSYLILTTACEYSFHAIRAKVDNHKGAMKRASQEMPAVRPPSAPPRRRSVRPAAPTPPPTFPPPSLSGPHRKPR